MPPPNTQTVKNTISSAVVNIICLGWDPVSRIANANAIAPRKPEKWMRKVNLCDGEIEFYSFLPKPDSKGRKDFQPQS